MKIGSLSVKDVNEALKTGSLSVDTFQKVLKTGALVYGLRAAEVPYRYLKGMKLCEFPPRTFRYMFPSLGADGKKSREIFSRLFSPEESLEALRRDDYSYRLHVIEMTPDKWCGEIAISQLPLKTINEIFSSSVLGKGSRASYLPPSEVQEILRKDGLDHGGKAFPSSSVYNLYSLLTEKQVKGLEISKFKLAVVNRMVDRGGAKLVGWIETSELQPYLERLPEHSSMFRYLPQHISALAYDKMPVSVNSYIFKHYENRGRFRKIPVNVLQLTLAAKRLSPGEMAQCLRDSPQLPALDFSQTPNETVEVLFPSLTTVKSKWPTATKAVVDSFLREQQKENAQFWKKLSSIQKKHLKPKLPPTALPPERSSPPPPRRPSPSPFDDDCFSSFENLHNTWRSTFGSFGSSPFSSSFIRTKTKREESCKILGIDKDADLRTAKKAYHKLSRRWHPDKNTKESKADREQAEGKMKNVNEAWDYLEKILPKILPKSS